MLTTGYGEPSQERIALEGGAWHLSKPSAVTCPPARPEAVSARPAARAEPGISRHRDVAAATAGRMDSRVMGVVLSSRGPGPQTGGPAAVARPQPFPSRTSAC